MINSAQKNTQSKLARKQSDSALSADEIYQLKRKAWLNKEGLSLNTEQINKLDQQYRWAIEIIGNLIYK